MVSSEWNASGLLKALFDFRFMGDMYKVYFGLNDISPELVIKCNLRFLLNLHTFSYAKFFTNPVVMNG